MKTPSPNDPNLVLEIAIQVQARRWSNVIQDPSLVVLQHIGRLQAAFAAYQLVQPTVGIVGRSELEILICILTASIAAALRFGGGFL